MHQWFHPTPIHLMHHTKVILYAFIKREGRRLRMLWGLLGIQHKVYSVSLHRLGEHLHSRHALRSTSIFKIGPPNTIFGFSSNITSFGSPSASSSIPKWDARCKCMNAKNGNMRCITNKHIKISTRLHHMTWAPREQVIYIKSNIG